MTARWLKRGALIACLLLLLANFAVVAIVTEGALHPPRKWHAKDEALYASGIAQATNAIVTPVSLTTDDGTILRGWWLLPKTGATQAVIVCHGIGDSAMGSLGFAALFLRNGFAVLVPESRGHGDSAGLVTYGVRESGDVMQWLQWIKSQGPSAVYGLGESLGGATLLQSLARGADFRAVVAESSYASFQEVADDRVGQVIGPICARILVGEAMLYARLRYRLDLGEARPVAAVAHSRVPILLIHGMADHETPPRHSEEIANANPAIQLWLVPHALHTGAYSAAPAEFESRVLAWFRAH